MNFFVFFSEKKSRRMNNRKCKNDLFHGDDDEDMIKEMKKNRRNQKMAYAKYTIITFFVMATVLCFGIYFFFDGQRIWLTSWQKVQIKREKAQLVYESTNCDIILGKLKERFEGKLGDDSVKIIEEVYLQSAIGAGKGPCQEAELVLSEWEQWQFLKDFLISFVMGPMVLCWNVIKDPLQSISAAVIAFGTFISIWTKGLGFLSFIPNRNQEFV